jgi:O-antigen/teichoic acid export membrane protein
VYKQSFFLSISKGLKSISALIITMVVARVLSQFDYGVYRQFILVASLLSGILSFGIPTALSYLFKSVNKQELSKLFTSTALVLGIINLITFLIIFIYKDFFITLISKNGEIEKYFYLLIFYIFTLVFFSFLENIYTSDNKGYMFARVNIFYFVIQLIIFVYISIEYKNLFLILFVLFILETLKGLYLYNLYKKLNSIRYDFDKSLIKSQILIAYPIGLSYIAQSLNQYLGNLYVSNKYSVEEFAIYSVGVTEIPLISIITISIATTILPVLSEKFNKDHNKMEMLGLWKNSTFVGSLFIFPVFWILLFFGDGYIEFIFSSEYLSAKTIYIIFLLKLPLAVTIFGNVLIVLNKSKYIIFNMIFGLVINILLIVLLSGLFGLKGVALAAVITQFILVIITLLQIKKVLGVKIIDLLPYKKMITLFVMSGLVVIIVYLLSRVFIDNNIYNLFIFGSLSYLVVNYIYYMMGYLDTFKQHITKRIRGVK